MAKYDLRRELFSRKDESFVPRVGDYCAWDCDKWMLGNWCYNASKIIEIKDGRMYLDGQSGKPYPADITHAYMYIFYRPIRTVVIVNG